MRKYFWICISAAAFMIGALIGYVMMSGAVPKAAAKSEREEAAGSVNVAQIKDYVPKEENLTVTLEETAPPRIATGYRVGEKDGYIALFTVYSDGSEKIYEVTAIPAASLRSDDRESVKSGIFVDSMEAALMLLEDFGS